MSKKEEITKEKCREWLRVDLTEEEMMAAAKESSSALIKFQRLEADLVEIKKRFKADLESQKLKMQTNSQLVENGYEYRNVDCLWEKDWAKGTKSMTRLDTHHVVKKDVKIENSERQKEIKTVK